MALSEKAHKKYSPFPEPHPGAIRLYSSRICPYSQAVRLVIAIKEIPHEIINIDLTSKPGWFTDEMPLKEVPVLRAKDGMHMFDSKVACVYLDEAYPDHPLQAVGPMKRAEERVPLVVFGKITTAYYKILSDLKSVGEKEKCQLDYGRLVDDTQRLLTWLDVCLGYKGNGFFGESGPGMTDLLIWPHMERIPALMKVASEYLGYDRLSVLHEGHERLHKWRDLMKNTDVVKNSMHTTDWHVEVFKLMIEKKPVADYGL